MVALVVRNARLWHEGRITRADVAIEEARIVAVGPALAVDGPELFADGRVLVPGFVDTHLHLDKARLRGQADGGLHEAIASTAAAKADFTPEDVYDRSTETLRQCLVQGTTKVRTQVEVDPVVGLRGFDGVLAAAEEFAWAIDVEICVFPQEGLALNPKTEQLLVDGLQHGATSVGGAPYTDRDPRGQIDLVFDLARRFDVDIDMHLDLAETIEDMQIDYVCAKTKEFGRGGRVTVGHVTQLSLLAPSHLDAVAQRLADAGVAVTSLPATDLFLMGRVATHAKPRGVAPLAALRNRGVICSLATNNVLNGFTPYGDCSLLRIANLYANVSHVSKPDELADCLSMITDQAAAIVGDADYGFGLGSCADMVLLDAIDPAAAVAEIAIPLWGMKAGHLTFTRERPQVHTPEGALRT